LAGGAGATPYGVRRRVRVDGPLGPVAVACSCDGGYCMSPAAHPIDPHWQRHVITTAAEVRLWWAGRSGMVPNIVLACGAAFHVWSVPRVIGSRALDLLPDNLALATPVAVTPTGRWHLFTAPRGTPEELPQFPARLDMLHMGAGNSVPAPPSTRGALGHDLWLREPLTRLAPCGLVAAALMRAAQLTVAVQARRGARGHEPSHLAAG
jgi:hypothetical protein